MHGSVRVGYGSSKDVAAEYNVKADAPACQVALSAAWPVVITPLDTCGLVHLKGDRYQQVRQSKDPLARAVIENYRLWSESQAGQGSPRPFERQSSTLFDTVAVYLAFSERGLTMEEMGIRVTADGFTRIDPAAKRMRVATAWTDQAGFEQFLADRMAGK
jgi:inosine-uridine nucleoside N-ribohydrolase